MYTALYFHSMKLVPPLRPALIWLTRGSHLHATCEAFVSRIGICDIVKSVLDHLIILFCMKLLIAWFSVVQRPNCSHEFFILQFGGHLNPLTVVTYMSPVEAFATAIKMFDRQNVCLISWSFPFEALDSLIFRVKGQIAASHSWSVNCSSSEATSIHLDLLIGPLDSVLQMI